MSSGQKPTVAERIRGKSNELTRAEQQLANELLANYPMLGIGSITTMAETAEVSTPTVIRMARKLGFKGFPDMQAELKSELEATISNPVSKHDRWAENVPATHMLNRFAEVAMENMRQTLKLVDPVDFDSVVNLLADKSRAVHVVGGRITRALADYFYTHMQVIRKDLTLIASNSNTWPHYILNMDEGDVLVVFDVRRYEHDILRLTKLAAEKGVIIVLMTDQWGSPVKSHAAHSFHSRIEAPSAWDSSVVTMFLVEAIIAAVETATWDETKERMDTLEELFNDTNMFRKFI